REVGGRASSIDSSASEAPRTSPTRREVESDQAGELLQNKEKHASSAKHRGGSTRASGAASTVTPDPIKHDHAQEAQSLSKSSSTPDLASRPRPRDPTSRSPSRAPTAGRGAAGVTARAAAAPAAGGVKPPFVLSQVRKTGGDDDIPPPPPPPPPERSAVAGRDDDIPPPPPEWSAVAGHDDDIPPPPPGLKEKKEPASYHPEEDIRPPPKNKPPRRTNKRKTHADEDEEKIKDGDARSPKTSTEPQDRRRRTDARSTGAGGSHRPPHEERDYGGSGRSHSSARTTSTPAAPSKPQEGNVSTSRYDKNERRDPKGSSGMGIGGRLMAPRGGPQQERAHPPQDAQRQSQSRDREETEEGEEPISWWRVGEDGSGEPSSQKGRNGQTVPQRSSKGPAGRARPPRGVLSGTRRRSS
ncbi:unnamed protein product, partial [Amoebophrya sp. A25]